MNSRLPVLIVGAGPTGLMMACELARHGVSFRIIDKKPERTLTSNAILIQTRTIEILDLVGIGERFVKRGHRCTAFNLYTNGEHTAKISLDQVDSPYPFILMLPQSETERLLSERLAELHVQIERSSELINVEQQDGKVISTIQQINGQRETITSEWLIACDGAHSTIRSQCGIFFSGQDCSEQFMVADAKMSSHLSRDEIHVFFAEGKILPDKATLFAAFPWGLDDYRIGANLYQQMPRQHFTEIEIKEIVAERTNGNYIVDSTSWISPFWIHSKMVSKLRHDSIFLAGDAAHIHSPLGGQGMNTGIQDAYNLAWKLAMVIKGKAKLSLLDSYQTERHPIVNEVVNTTEQYTQMAIFDKTFMTKLRQFAQGLSRSQSKLSREISMQLTQLSIQYKNSPAIDYSEPMPEDAPQQGTRAPDVLIDKSTRLYDYLRNKTHNILFFVGTTTEKSSLREAESLQQWLHREYPELFKMQIIAHENIKDIDNTIIDSNNAIHQRYHVATTALYIIRPDNYIAYYAQKINRQAIERFLREFILPISITP